MTTVGLTGAAQATPSRVHPTAAAPTAGSSDVGEYSASYFAKHRKLDRKTSEAAVRQARTSARTAGNGTVGSMKLWPTEDFVSGALYLKTYKLRGVGDHIQIWVANDRAFPTDDCRNDLGITDVTNAQVKAFIHQYDDHMLPIESKAFSVAPDQNGAKSAALAQQLGLPKTYWTVGKNHADDTVVLVDNIRDENYYTPDTPAGQTRVAGFFTPQYTELFHRNMMTIDSYDWTHQSGANPPDDSKNPAYIACGKELGTTPGRLGRPDPRQYEGTFAHEYQHLLESYEDPDEVSWVNEGLSDYAQTLTGYVNPAVSPLSTGADSHIACFEGYDGERFGGAENSLTNWGDQGGPEILCDYGAAYSFMQYLYDHFGEGFLSALHTQNGNGLVGLQKVLDKRAGGVKAMDVLHRWSATMALDAILDRNGGKLVGGNAKNYQSKTLTGRINWANPQSYQDPGAPTNGSDYVRLRDASGKYLSADQIDSIDFSGSTTYPPKPVEWTADSTPPDATTADTTCGTTPDGTGAAALYSGCGDELDRSITHSVTVPATGDQSLSFDVLYDTEQSWDFGFVQVSTDGGKTWTSLATQDTTSDHDPNALPYVVSELPGFTGDSGTWKHETADLSAYAGKDILVGFRYITDPATAEAGMWVRNVTAAGATLPTDSTGEWKTITEVSPFHVPGYTVQLVAYGTSSQPAYLSRLTLDDAFHGTLAGADVAKALGTTGSYVAAIVTADDPSEQFSTQAPYTLTVNGVVQPGGPAS
ncbi:MAG: choice-of-anchor J domain-containing protein [Nocardioidaceae bacterium]